MKKTKRSTIAVMVLGAVFALAFASTFATAGGPAMDTAYLTFSGPVSLPGLTLERGTYVFERADAMLPHVVRVWSRTRSHVYFTGFTIPVTRPDGRPRNRPIAFREAAAGSAPEIDVWYPEGKSTGEQFMYVDRR